MRHPAAPTIIAVLLGFLAFMLMWARWRADGPHEGNPHEGTASSGQAQNSSCDNSARLGSNAGKKEEERSSGGGGGGC